ncbi:type II secretion system protein GspN [Thermodesulfovibrionales bacterium]|nr:type II secretion system protein GspN [Thermodesulfovibrionales bacterium]
MKRIFFISISVAAAMLTFTFGFWLIVVTENMLKGFIADSVKRYNISVVTDDFKKGLFYSFRAQSIVFKRSDEELIVVDDVAGKINLHYLLRLKPTLSLRGNIGGGMVTGDINLLEKIRGSSQSTINIDGAGIDEIPIFSVIGLSGEGILSAEFKLKNRVGELRFSIDDTRFENPFLAGVTLPLEVFHTINGVATMKDDNIEIASLTMRGDGVHARISGNIERRVTDVTIEIMRDASFVDDISLFLPIRDYEVSTGYYVIPLRGRTPF